MHELPRYKSFVTPNTWAACTTVAWNQHVVVDELGRTRGIGEDAAHRAGDEKHELRPVGRNQ
jgi:hypothetical protein